MHKLTHFKTFDKPDRDPRGRTITTVFYAILTEKPVTAMASDDASELGWFNLKSLPLLAFDHKYILHDAMNSVL